LPATAELYNAIGVGARGVVDPVGNSVLGVATRVGADRFEQGEGLGRVLLERQDVGGPDAARTAALDGAAADVGIGIVDPRKEEIEGWPEIGEEKGAEDIDGEFADGHVAVGGEGAGPFQALGDGGAGIVTQGEAGPYANDVGAVGGEVVEECGFVGSSVEGAAKGASDAVETSDSAAPDSRKRRRGGLTGSRP